MSGKDSSDHRPVLDWLATLLELDNHGKYSCSLPSTCGRPLFTRKDPEMLTGHKDFLVRDGQSQRCLLPATGDVSAYLYVNLRWHLYIDLHCERTELLPKAFVTKKVEIPPSLVFVGRQCAQPGGSEWRGGQYGRYYKHLTPEN